MKLAAIALCAVSLMAPRLALSQTHKGSALQVHVDYKGAGTIDQTHKIFVVLWDSPDFVKGAVTGPPFAVTQLTSKSGTVKFDDVEHNPVYLSMAYDPTGAWAGDTEPPVGASLGLYSKEPGTPAPIKLEPGKITKISVVLDDSFKKQPMEKKP